MRKAKKSLKIQGNLKFLLTFFEMLCYTMRCVERRLIRFTAHFRKKMCRVSVILLWDDRNSDRRCLKHGNQAYLSAQEAARPEGPRLPQENGYRQRPQGPGSSPRKGPRPSVLLSKADARETLEQRSFRDGGRWQDPSVPIRVSVQVWNVYA